MTTKTHIATMLAAGLVLAAGLPAANADSISPSDIPAVNELVNDIVCTGVDQILAPDIELITDEDGVHWASIDAGVDTLVIECLTESEGGFRGTFDVSEVEAMIPLSSSIESEGVEFRISPSEFVSFDEDGEPSDDYGGGLLGMGLMGELLSIGGLSFRYDAACVAEVFDPLDPNGPPLFILPLVCGVSIASALAKCVDLNKLKNGKTCSWMVAAGTLGVGLMTAGRNTHVLDVKGPNDVIGSCTMNAADFCGDGTFDAGIEGVTKKGKYCVSSTAKTTVNPAVEPGNIWVDVPVFNTATAPAESCDAV